VDLLEIQDGQGSATSTMTAISGNVTLTVSSHDVCDVRKAKIFFTCVILMMSLIISMPEMSSGTSCQLRYAHDILDDNSVTRTAVHDGCSVADIFHVKFKL
jgi:hypothetical protein